MRLAPAHALALAPAHALALGPVHANALALAPLHALALALGACTAAPNPEPPTVPSAYQPPPVPVAASSAPNAANAPNPAPGATSSAPGAKSMAPGATSPALGATSPALGAQSAAQAESKPAAAPRDVGVSTPPAPAATPARTTPSTTTITGPSVAPRRVDAGVPIAYVGGRPIDVTELLAQWIQQDSIQLLDEIDHLVLGRLVLAEAGRLGVSVAPDLVEKAYVDSVAQIEKVIGEKRAGVTLDLYVDQALGLDPLVYRERLRDEALRSLLAERVVRAWILESERAEIRVVVVKTEADVKAVKDALAAHEPFEDIARRLSADASAKDGGHFAPVVGTNTLMGRLAAQTGTGEVGGPLYEKGSWLFVKVDARPNPIEGDWSKIAADVLQSLSERKLEGLEIRQWKDAMAAKYTVDLAPILKLTGQPVK